MTTRFKYMAAPEAANELEERAEGVSDLPHLATTSQPYPTFGSMAEKQPVTSDERINESIDQTATNTIATNDEVSPWVASGWNPIAGTDYDRFRRRAPNATNQGRHFS